MNLYGIRTQAQLVTFLSNFTESSLNSLLEKWEQHPSLNQSKFDALVSNFIELTIHSPALAEQIAKKVFDISPSGYQELTRRAVEKK